MTDKKIIPQQEPKEPKAAQAAPDPDQKNEQTITAEEMRHIKLTAAGDPLPINPDTGEIDIDKLTDEQRAELEAASEIIKEAIKKVLPSVPPALKSFIEKNLNIANTFSKTTVVGEKLNDLIQNIHIILQPIEDLHKELNELEPYLIEEMAKPGYKGKTFDYLKKYELRELVELRNDPESFLSKAIEEARKAKAEARHITIQHADNVEYPLDKINSNVWNLLTEDTGGQLKIAFDLLPKKQKQQATAYYSINFDNLGDNVEITKRLQPFDKRVYIAVSALYNTGNDVITATQIYYAMGNTGKPAPNQIKKIDDSLSKMKSADITLNNQREHDSLKGKYPLFKYDGSLLPFERITATINGQIAESAIHIFREPPLMTFAKERKQVTTIAVELLQSPISKTDANLLIDDYLIKRISRAKNGKNNSCRILYKTLYENANIKTKMQRQRAPAKIEKYLTYYQQQKFIKRYTTHTDGITIFF